MTINWTIHHGGPDFDFYHTLSDALATENILDDGPTEVTIGGGGMTVVLTGNFGYTDGVPGPESGEVNGIAVYDNGVLVAEATGYALDVADLDQVLTDLAGDDYSSFRDLFFGTPGPRIVIDGSEDRDVFFGAGSTKYTMHGNDGNDRLQGGVNDDKIFGDAGKDNLSGNEGDDLVKGSGGKDQLSGGLGEDTLRGGGGGDWLSGGSGDDDLVGGKGNDRFVFFDLILGNGPGKAGVDTIADLHPGQDVIQLDKLVFAGIGNKLNAGEFHVGGHAEDGNDHILYNASTGALFYDPDGDGVGAKVKFAVLANKPDLSNDDFVMI